MLQIKDLHAGYGGSSIIQGVSLQIKAGEKICILGRNGVGKTTLLKSIMGILKPTKGSIIYQGEDITSTKIYRRSRLGLAYVPQGREIFPFLTVKENLLMGCIARNMSEQEKLIKEILEYFPALGAHLERKGGVLSGGQQQQLAIARALISKPKILFLDEPSEGIQPSVIQEIIETLIHIQKEQNLSLFIVEQNLDFVSKIAERFYVMEKGMIIREGYTAEIKLEEISSLFHQPSVKG